jgi:NAD(P)-dependent dehydrogenase (short-subunit alcohol dehydrogenase family)
MKLNNKVPIVTGAHQGIGFATTQKPAAEGAIVYAFDIKGGADIIAYNAQ